MRSGSLIQTKETSRTTLAYNFTMPARDYVELLCDFRGSHGSVRFDLNSLKLVRKGKTPRPGNRE